MTDQPTTEGFTEDFQANPYPVFAQLREHAPVHCLEVLPGFESWLVTRYDDVRSVLNDRRISKAPQRVAEAVRRVGLLSDEDEGETALISSMLNSDPPDHTRLRRLVGA